MIKNGIIFTLALLLVVSFSACNMPHEHEWQDADCNNPRTCSVCNMTEGEKIGHDWLRWTCTEPSKCSRCGEKLPGSNPKGHTPTNWVVDKESTCSQMGLEHSICSDCGESFDKTIPTEEHNLVQYTNLSSTSTYTAVKEEWCSDCEYHEKTEYEVSGDERKKLYKQKCYSPSYEAIARNPSMYVGDLGVYTGQVIQVSGSTLRVNVTRYYGYWDDTMLITSCYGYDGGGRILEDDIIQVYGEITGVTSYETVLGSTITIPSMKAEYVNRVYYR